MFTDAHCDPLETLKFHQLNSWVVAVVSRTDNKKQAEVKYAVVKDALLDVSQQPNETSESHLNDDW